MTQMERVDRGFVMPRQQKNTQSEIFELAPSFTYFMGPSTTPTQTGLRLIALDDVLLERL